MTKSRRRWCLLRCTNDAWRSCCCPRPLKLTLDASGSVSSVWSEKPVGGSNLVQRIPDLVLISFDCRLSMLYCKLADDVTDLSLYWYFPRCCCCCSYCGILLLEPPLLLLMSPALASSLLVEPRANCSILLIINYILNTCCFSFCKYWVLYSGAYLGLPLPENDFLS